MDIRKQHKWKKPVALALGVFLLLGLFVSNSTEAAAENVTYVSDDSSFNSWEDYLTNEDGSYTTENIGRIWTDKTVTEEEKFTFAQGALKGQTIEKGDSDFLVALSALSSTSNITTETNIPLDIVLVLDVSGSMSEGLDYTEIYTTDESYTTSATYYILRNGSWQEVTYQNRQWRYRNNTVTPKTSEDDTNTSHVQFYTERTKLEALKEAVANFIETTAEVNSSIADASLQHRIALVKFAGDENAATGNSTYRHNQYTYNYTQVVSGLTVYTEGNTNSLITTINSLRAGGTTGADYAFSRAEAALEGSRENAQKVVIFFTDGEPNHQNNFDADVANDAIAKAKALKDDGTLVYAIGVFEDAEPDYTTEDTSSDKGKFNAYMNGVSSNYPSAESYTSLGERAANGSYYKAAASSEELNSIFQEIASEIQETAAGVPTKIGEGYGGTDSGYITFTDELGAYMQADDFKCIVYNNEMYTNLTVTETGGVKTYVFSAKVEPNAAAEEETVNLNRIIITVTPGSSLAEGDTVTVQIPADLIPLRNFEIDENEDGELTMEVEEAYPIRIFFGVSVKDGVLEDTTDADGNPVPAAVSNPDEEMLAYLADHTITDEDGNTTAAFYSNLWTGGDDGDTTAVFEPASNNRFYYFASSTTVYSDADCTQTVKETDTLDDTADYYYKRTVYVKNSKTGAVEETEVIYSFPGSNFAVSDDNYAYDSDGNLYIKSTTHRLTRVNDTKAEKTENTTGTAETVINPTWADPDEGELISVALGNNGRLTAQLPGTLAVTKTALVAEGSVGPVDEDGNSTLDEQEFTFELSLADADGSLLSGTYLARVETGNTAGTVFELTFTDGKAEYSLKNNQTLFIYGLPEGAAYTVTEDSDSMPAGFTQTAPAENGACTGEIEAAQTSEAEFTNTYRAEAVTLAEGSIQVQKVFDYWQVADEGFEMRLEAVDNAPLPDGEISYQSVIVTEENQIRSFGAITYTEVGTYVYTVYEKTPENHADQILGVSYSDILYRVIVYVTDDGEGKLQASVEMWQTHDEGGEQLAESEKIGDNIAVITNTFEVEQTSVGLVLQKEYTENGTDKYLAAGAFTFEVKPVSSYGDGSNTEIPMPNSRTATNAADGSITFGQATFTQDDVGNTYVYKFSEVIPDEAETNGITYDTSVYYAHVSITTEEKDGEAYVKAIVTYREGVAADSEVVDTPVFHNTYTAAPVTLTGSTAIRGQKTISGRSWLEQESYSYTLVAGDEYTEKALADGVISLADDAEELTAEASGSEDGTVEFTFGDITFTKIGVYTFAVTEASPTDPAGGVTCDGHTAQVIVTVTDNGAGQLEAEVSYDNTTALTDSDQSVTDKAAFTNVYKASLTYGNGAGLTVAKTLTGRDMKAGEFTFTIRGIAGDSVTAEEADAKLSNGDRTFVNAAAADSEASAITKLRAVSFTEQDAGKTYVYEIKETEGALGGVTYDPSVYQVSIQVIDNLDGTMHTVTTVTKITDSDGTSITDPVGLVYDSSQPDAGTPALSFANSYQAAETSYDTAKAELYKVLVGREWTDADAFEFAISKVSLNNSTSEEALDEMPMPANKTQTVTKKNEEDAEGHVSFSFGSITFTKAGVYVYEVKEKNAGTTENGLTYSDNAATIQITVTDDENGNLTARAQIYQNGFINVYKADSLELDGDTYLKVTKSLEGRAWFESDSFTFTLAAGDEETEAAADNGTILLPDTEITICGTDAEKEKAFGSIEFKATGTYTFVITESQGSILGITYDTHEVTITVVVIDDGKGELTAAAPAITGSMTFTNTYTPDSVQETLKGTKVMSGRALTGNDIFSFTIAASGENTPMPAVTTVTNNANGEIQFAPITYTEAGAYSYTITETAGSADGVTNDSGSVEAVVTVDYNEESGELSVTGVSYTKTGGNGGEGFTFTNVYEAAPTDAVNVFNAVKNVIASEGSDYTMEGGEFEFTITPSANNPASDPIVIASVSNDAEGSITFASDVEYTEPGTYIYSISETANGLAGITYDDSVYEITVVVSDDTAAAKLQAEVTIKKDGEEVGAISFDNGYKPEQTTAIISGTKELTGKTLEAGQFSFTLSASGENKADTPLPETITASNDAAGSFQFGAITYTEAGTYEYTVSETNGEETGYTYDPAAHTVTVTVTDEEGELKADISGMESLVFNNSYQPNPVTLSGDTALKGSKTLDGRTMAEGEFAFELVDAQGSVISTARNQADGSFAFDSVTFTAEGTYYYTIKESNTGLGGITYDTSVYTAVITVTDVDGQLQAEVKYRKDGTEAEVIFENQYEAKGTEVQLGAIKKLTGRTLQENEFFFELRDADGNVLQSRTNDASGVVTFGALTFDEEGQYAYTISEAEGSLSYVTYDSTVYEVTITVTDNLQGSLTASVAYTDYDGAVPVFTNTYKAPSVPEKPDTPSGDSGSSRSSSASTSTVTTPQTGDNAPVIPILITIAAALTALIGVLLAIRKRSRR